MKLKTDTLYETFYHVIYFYTTFFYSLIFSNFKIIHIFIMDI